MPITDWPKADRPREKLLQQGEIYLTDAELIAICLGSGKRGQTALDIAKDLLAEHKSLQNLLRLPSHAVIGISGIGPAKYALLRAALELGRRYLQDEVLLGEPINTSLAAQRFIYARLHDKENEVFACLFLTSQLSLIRYEELFHGTINEASVYPRELVRRGLAHNAANIILAHNHPSGCIKPSTADQETTRLIQQAMGLIDIEVLDHIIVGHQGCFSFADSGLLVKPQKRVF